MNLSPDSPGTTRQRIRQCAQRGTSALRAVGGHLHALRAVGSQQWLGDGTDGPSLTDDRAVGPVVAVVLLVALTIALALIAAPMVFSFAGSTGDSTPNANFAFGYSEDVEPTFLDSFGVPGGGPGGTGLLTIIYERGDTIPPGELVVETEKSGGSLELASEFGDDSALQSGDRFSIWVGRGETVRIIWQSPDGEQSATLGSFNVETADPLPPGIPRPDAGCEAVASQTPGDVSIDGSVVECNLDEYDVDDIDITGGGAVIGEVAGNGTVTLDAGEVYFGDVRAGIDGSTESVSLAGESEVNGDVVAGGDGTVDIQSDSTVDGAVFANGTVTVHGDSSVRASVDTSEGTGDIIVRDGSGVSHAVTAGGAAEVTGDGVVGGDVDAATTVTVDGSTVEGGVTGDTGVSIDTSTVGGTVSSPGDVSVVDSTVGGEVVVDGSFTCIDSTISGESCETYKSPTLDVTIDQTGSPVEEGEPLTVTATFDNANGFEGTADLELLVEGTIQDEMTVSFDREEKRQETFTWETSTGDDGEHTATVRSDDDEATVTVVVFESDVPFFDVTLDAYDDTVVEGENLTVTATVENIGSEPGTQDISFVGFDGSLLDSNDGLALNPDESEQFTLRWETAPGDAESGTLAVTSEDIDRSFEAAVEQPVYNVEDILVSSGSGANDIALFVTVDTNDENAEMILESVDGDGVVLDSRTVAPETGEYELEGADSAAFVRATLYDGEGIQQDEETESW